MDRHRAYHCYECYRDFKKFVIFEGHFSFYQQCRDSIGSYMQCYICREEFHNLAALKYHLRSHENQFYEHDSTTNTPISSRQYYAAVKTTGSNRINNETSGNDDDQNAFPTYAGPETINYCCGVCGKGFLTKFHLKEHSVTHSAISAVSKNGISEIDSAQKSAKEGLDRPTVDNGGTTCLVENNGTNGVQSERISTSNVTISANKKKGRVYQCSICKAKFTSKYTMQNHQKIHAYGTMVCKICKVKFTRIALIRHQREFHPKFFNSKCSSDYRQCPVCKMKFYGGKLERHIKIHYLGTITCEICNIKFTDRTFLQHQKQCGSRSIEQERCEKPVEIEQSNDQEQMSSTANVSLKGETIKGRVYQCSICKAKLTSKISMQNHQKIHAYGTMVCKICKVKFTRMALIRHQREFHPKFFNSKCSSDYRQCPVCKMKFYGGKLERHIKIHYLGTITCEICKIKFTDRTFLQHQKQCGSTSIEQERCEKPVEIEQSKDHEQMSSTTNVSLKGKMIKGRVYQCSLCKAKFSHRDFLRKHMNVHTYGTVTCEICKIKFTRIGLAQHKKSFHQEISNSVSSVTNVSLRGKIIKGRVYQCSVCKAKFSERNFLSVHMKVHTVGTVACKICKIKFTQRSLAQHQKAFHGKCFPRKKTTQCPICELTLYRSNLNKHVKLHESGTAACNICNIKFSPFTLAQHNKLFHPQTQQIHKCDLCELSFIRKDYLQLHLKSPQHLNKVDNDVIVIKTEEPVEIPDIGELVEASDVRAHVEASDIGATVEASDIGAQFDDLSEHMTHSTIQQWIDPATVYLSNWSPGKSGEILRNQPLVMVENLNIEQINLKSLNDFIQQTNRPIEDLFTNDSQRLEPDVESVQHEEKPNFLSDLIDLNDSFPNRYVTLDATERNVSENDFSEWEDLYPTYTFCDLVDEQIASVHDCSNTKQVERIQDADSIHSTFKVENVNEDYMNGWSKERGEHDQAHSFRTNSSNSSNQDYEAVSTIEITSESDDDVLMISKTF